MLDPIYITLGQYHKDPSLSTTTPSEQKHFLVKTADVLQRVHCILI